VKLAKTTNRLYSEIMKILTIASLYIVAWVLFAIYDFSSRDIIVVYQSKEVLESEKTSPIEVYLDPIVYRISGQVVVEKKISSFLKKYNDCAVIDIENWRCTYSDKSAHFGFSKGTYFIAVEPPKPINRNINVSRLEWLGGEISKALIDEDWLQILILPFVK